MKWIKNIWDHVFFMYVRMGECLCIFLKGSTCSGVYIMRLTPPPRPLTLDNGIQKETTAQTLPQPLAIWCCKTWLAAHSVICN